MALRNRVTLWGHKSSKLITAPAIEPVNARRLRNHLVETDDNLPNDQAHELIREAREWIEDHYNIAMINQTWRVVLDHWPTGGGDPWWDGQKQMAISELDARSHLVDVIMPKFPLSSITSCSTFDADSVETAVVVTDTFDVDTYSKLGRMSLKRGMTWPTALRPLNAIQIDYVAGYGTAADDVPAPLRRAVLQLAAGLHAHRGDCDAAGIMVASGAHTILNSFRNIRI